MAERRKVGMPKMHDGRVDLPPQGSLRVVEDKCGVMDCFAQRSKDLCDARFVDAPAGV